MAGGGRLRKRVKAETEAPPSSSPSVVAAGGIKRARDGSGFTKCEECNKNVAVALISFHDCGLEAKIKMNLEAQVIEAPNETKKKKPAEKRKAEPKAKKVKKAKNPNAPKRPPTAFFVFMDDFRKSFKEANPDCKSVATVAKEGGEKWKSMTAEEKKPYVDKAAELKAEYEKATESENPDNEQDEGDATENEAKEELEDKDDEVEETENEVKEEEIEDDDE